MSAKNTANLSMWCVEKFFQWITLSIRYGTHSCSLIDQFFCKVPHKQENDISTSMIISNMSDHFPFVVNVKTPDEGRKQDKLIHNRTINDSVMIDL